MIQFRLKPFNKLGLLFILSIVISFASCETSEYDRTVKEEMSKNIQLDTLKFGLAFGDTHQQFWDKCTVLNKKHLITRGDVGFMAVHQIYDSVQSRHMKYHFYAKFPKDEDHMTGLDMQFSYNGWSPWSEHTHSDKLIVEVMDTLMKWYPGNTFKMIDNEKLEQPLYYKIDGNRQIILHTKGLRDVIGIIEDLNHKYD